VTLARLAKLRVHLLIARHVRAFVRRCARRLVSNAQLVEERDVVGDVVSVRAGGPPALEYATYLERGGS
jgi:hypothetical protein